MYKSFHFGLIYGSQWQCRLLLVIYWQLRKVNMRMIIPFRSQGRRTLIFAGKVLFGLPNQEFSCLTHHKSQLADCNGCLITGQKTNKFFKTPGVPLESTSPFQKLCDQFIWSMTMVQRLWESKWMAQPHRKGSFIIDPPLKNHGTKPCEMWSPWRSMCFFGVFDHRATAERPRVCVGAMKLPTNTPWSTLCTQLPGPTETGRSNKGWVNQTWYLILKDFILGEHGNTSTLRSCHVSEIFLLLFASLMLQV